MCTAIPRCATSTHGSGTRTWRPARYTALTAPTPCGIGTGSMKKSGGTCPNGSRPTRRASPRWPACCCLTRRWRRSANRSCRLRTCCRCSASYGWDRLRSILDSSPSRSRRSRRRRCPGASSSIPPRFDRRRSGIRSNASFSRIAPVTEQANVNTDRAVLVSGCFDLLHAGHVEFLRRAARYGRLHVIIGSDQTIRGLKGRYPVNDERQRLEVVKAIRWVHDARVGSGSGWLDFEPELRAIRPYVFVVNDDGDKPEKRALCEELGIEYVVLERTPGDGVAPTSASAIRQRLPLPFRIEIAGGWLDQPFISRLHPGAVIVASIEAGEGFVQYTGLAASSRNSAIELWGGALPTGDAVRHAQMLFAYDNAPGRSSHVSGSQDHLGLLLPGVNRLDYAGEYWPQAIASITDESTLAWLESVLRLVPLCARDESFDPLANMRPSAASAKQLAAATDNCWRAIESRNAAALGESLTASLCAQLEMFTAMAPPHILRQVQSIAASGLGAKMSGAGGGGYVLAVASNAAEGIPIRIRRPAAEYH
ncbi:MAG: adenylyltransferase/cytidyltransferase family protein [Phycisphaera sp.]|nr:adenylyltransferase/cytidyltransferase family protein [Phycisphaera sp.]